MPTIPLGSWVRDTVTECTVIVVARTMTYKSETTYAVQPRLLCDGISVPDVWIVEGRLERMTPPQN